jgi:hypothetical protein
MNVHFPAQRRWASRLAHLAVIIVVLALAAATFVLSYTGVHSIALQAGVPTRLARIYPGIFDAALVIACAAALMLREGRWWARAYAWLSIILVIAVVGAADAVHAMNVALPHRETAGVIAAAPWVLVLLGFTLWLTMLRQSRTRSVGQPPQPTATQPAAPDLPRPTMPDLPRLEATPAEPVAALPIPEGTGSDEGTPISDEAAVSGETTVPKEAVGPEEAVAPESTAPAEAAAEYEPATVAGREPAPPSGTPAEEAARTDRPSALPRDYWSTGNTGEPDSQPATAPPMMRGRRVPAALDEEEPPLPFVTVPRLRRVRSTPTPPEDDDEDQ